METTGELDILRGAHVDQAQGFLMGRPLDVESFETRHLVASRLTVSP